MQRYDFPFHAMGTRCELRLFAVAAAEASACAAAVQADVERLEAKYSRYRATSELSAINRVAAAGGTVQV
ncbi:MAG: hypothetical protein RLZZ169_351, partial [Pseudomonadota bacterium]